MALHYGAWAAIALAVATQHGCRCSVTPLRAGGGARARADAGDRRTNAQCVAADDGQPRARGIVGALTLCKGGGCLPLASMHDAPGCRWRSHSALRSRARGGAARAQVLRATPDDGASIPGWPRAAALPRAWRHQQPLPRAAASHRLHSATRRCSCACVPSASTSATCSTCSASTRATQGRRVATRRAWCARRRCSCTRPLGLATHRSRPWRSQPALPRQQAATLSFEQACTLPVTWSTTHAAVERAGLRAGTHASCRRRRAAWGSRRSSTRSGCRHRSWARRGGRTSMPICAATGVNAYAARATAPPSHGRDALGRLLDRTPCSTASRSTSSPRRLRRLARVAPLRRLASAASGRRIAIVQLQRRPRTARSRSTPTWRSTRLGCAACSRCSQRVRCRRVDEPAVAELQHGGAARAGVPHAAERAQHGQDRRAHRGADDGLRWRPRRHGRHGWAWPPHRSVARAAWRTLPRTRVAQRGACQGHGRRVGGDAGERGHA